MKSGVNKLVGGRGLGSRAQRPWLQEGRECPLPVHLSVSQPLEVSVVPGNASSRALCSARRHLSCRADAIAALLLQPGAWRGEGWFTVQAPGASSLEVYLKKGFLHLQWKTGTCSRASLSLSGFSGGRTVVQTVVCKEGYQKLFASENWK